MPQKIKTYIAFLRGINVGGNHKLPMAELKLVMTDMGFRNVVTLLNSGNVIFTFQETDVSKLESDISIRLEEKFGFPVPTIVKAEDEIRNLFASNPFVNIELTKDIRQYISFQKVASKSDLSLPWESEDESFQILSQDNGMIISVLDLSRTGTPKAMKIIEEKYGKDITTRNWKTIERIAKKLP